MKKLLFMLFSISLSSLFISGCLMSSQQIAQSASAGKLGCPPQEVVITDHQISFANARSWTASCKGQTYYCSGVSTGQGAYSDVSCTKKK